MKTAIKGEQLLDLDTINRSSYQQIYEDGKKGLLTCPVCSDQVKLYLSIEKAPFFQHSNTNNHCQDIIISQMETAATSEQIKEVNGFRLPQSKTISNVTNIGNHYKPAKSVQYLPTFTASERESARASSPYIESLEKKQIFLDANQLAAVTHPNGALLVLSGAGSGKTRVLTARTSYLLSEKQVQANRIMLVTFTAKAAAEMKERLLSFPNIKNHELNRLVTGTFHSIFYRILSHHYPQKWNSSKLLNKEWQRRQILKDAGKELELDEKEFPYDAAIQQIGYWKNSLISPNEVIPSSSWEEKVVFLYKKYEEFKSNQELFDFDDMLTGCYELFLHDPSILELYQNRFDYFLIDEFQDINKVQYELIKILSAKKKNVFVVGDDDQSIYAFRGSNPKYLRDFEKDFPEAEVVILNENYRSSHPIVATANKLITDNKGRRPKKMQAQFTNDLPPTLFFPVDEEEEATMILTDIQEKIIAGAEPRDFAILFRTNTASRATFERLTNSNLPFVIDQDIEPFYERFIVRSMLSFLKLSLNEDDHIALTNALPALFLKQTLINDIKADSILKDCSFLECLSHVKTNFSFQQRKLKKVVPVIRSLSTLSPLVAMEKVDKELGFQDFLKKRGNEGNQWDKGSDDLRDLKVAAKNFSTIHEFLQHAEHMTAMNKEIKKQSRHQDNAITLSTIHRSKGLEYKNVYVLATVDGSIPHDYALESLRSGDSEPLEEERRLLYVAVTRAQKNLYISVPENRRGKKANPSRFLASIRY